MYLLKMFKEISTFEIGSYRELAEATVAAKSYLSILADHLGEGDIVLFQTFQGRVVSAWEFDIESEEWLQADHDAWFEHELKLKERLRGKE